MGKTIRTATTRRSNGGVTTRHRVVIEHDRAPTLNESQLSLDAVMRRANPPHPRVHRGGSGSRRG